MPEAGDDWANWLDRHGPALVLFARAWVPSRADAEDVIQEAFVRFWRARHRADDPTAYLFACVKRCALNWVRARGRRDRREAAAARPESESLFDGPVEQAERRAAVAAALDALPAAQREVLVMKIWGGLTFPQVAAVLGIPPDTAASRFRYALSKLRELLTEESIP
jgi:RNA polymerase sigma-70 factor (ECF subfamily)